MRNQAREAALSVIFSEQFGEDCTDAFKEKVYKNFELTKEEDIAFAKELIQAVKENEALLKQKIDEACHHYHVDRINRMDKTILLIAMAEILFFDDIPNVVSASEATGLARKYSTEASVDFVNGVLAGVIRQGVEQCD